MFKNFSFLSEGILIAIVPAVSYWIAFKFESGYLDFFDIPTYVIKISLENIFVAFGVVITSGFVLYRIIDMSLLILPEKYYRGAFLYLPLMFFLVIAAVIILYSKSYYNALAYISAIGMAILPNYLLAFMPIHGETYSERLKNHLLDKTSPGEGLTNKLLKSSHVASMLIIILCIAVLQQAAYGLGYILAKDAQTFLMTKIDQKEYVLLRKYDTLAIYLGIEGPCHENNAYSRRLDIKDILFDETQGRVSFTPIVISLNTKDKMGWSN